MSLSFFQHFLHHFYTEKKIFKKKRRFCGLPTGHNYGHPVDRKQTFFKGGLMPTHVFVSSPPPPRQVWSQHIPTTRPPPVLYMYTHLASNWKESENVNWSVATSWGVRNIKILSKQQSNEYNTMRKGVFQ